MSQPDKRCGNCRWWGAHDIPSEWGAVRECRRRSPSLTVTAQTAFPFTPEDVWCGDWARETADAPAQHPFMPDAHGDTGCAQCARPQDDPIHKEAT